MNKLGLQPHDHALVEGLSALPDKALDILIERLTAPDRECELISDWTAKRTPNGRDTGPHNQAGCLVGLSMTWGDYEAVAVGLDLNVLAILTFPEWTRHEIGWRQSFNAPLPQASVDRVAWMLELERNRRRGLAEAPA